MNLVAVLLKESRILKYSVMYFILSGLVFTKKKQNWKEKDSIVRQIPNKHFLK